MFEGEAPFRLLVPAGAHRAKRSVVKSLNEEIPPREEAFPFRLWYLTFN